MPRPTLRTERLVMVPQTRAAAEALLEGRDPGLPLGPGYPHADTLDGLRLWVEHGDADEGGWFVTLAEDGRVIGDCGTHGGPDDRGAVEIGYGLAAEFRARGLGTEAVRAMTDWLEAQPGVRALSASVEIGNLASRRLLERLGFRLAGTEEGEWLLVRVAPPSVGALAPGEAQSDVDDVSHRESHRPSSEVHGGEARNR